MSNKILFGVWQFYRRNPTGEYGPPVLLLSKKNPKLLEDRGINYLCNTPGVNWAKWEFTGPGTTILSEKVLTPNKKGLTSQNGKYKLIFQQFHWGCYPNPTPPPLRKPEPEINAETIEILYTKLLDSKWQLKVLEKAITIGLERWPVNMVLMKAQGQLARIVEEINKITFEPEV